MNKKTPRAEQSGAPHRSAEPHQADSAEKPLLLRLNQTIGNFAVQRLFRAGIVRAKLDISSPDDISEREADRTADEVMHMPEPAAQRKGACPGGNDVCEEEETTVQTKPLALSAEEDQGPQQAGTDGDASLEALRAGGQPLPDGVRSFFEPRFGHDFSGVRVHTDVKASELARRLNAKAFTVGKDVVFGEDRYRPDTPEGQGLLAHELTHVAQQGKAGPLLQRQTIPEELLSSADVAGMSETELQERYDLIVQTLAQFNASSAETADLENEAGRIGVELARRTALAAGRTFEPARIEAMRRFFITNAGSAAPASCIATLNTGMRTVLSDPGQAVRGEIQTTMAQLQTSGRAGPAEIIEYNDVAGRLTTGTTEPVAPRQSIWDALLQLAGRDVGWSVYGMSLVDGYHSVTLTLDNNDPAQPRVYWSDQWTARGGWQEFNRVGLDAEVLQLTRNFRVRFNTEHGGASWPRTRTTLWRLRP